MAPAVADVAHGLAGRGGAAMAAVAVADSRGGSEAGAAGVRQPAGAAGQARGRDARHQPQALWVAVAACNPITTACRAAGTGCSSYSRLHCIRRC